MINVEEWKTSSEVVSCAFQYDEQKHSGKNQTFFDINLKKLTCMDNVDLQIVMKRVTLNEWNEFNEGILNFFFV